MTSLSVEELSDLAGKRALNYYKVHGLCCSEAIVLVLVKGFGAKISDDLAIGTASGLCGGMGGGECVCGALSGAVVALGVYLAPSCRKGLSKSKMRKTTKLFHDNFRDKFGSTCCKDLTKDAKSRKVKMENCGRITSAAAQMSTKTLLEKRPDLLERADLEFLKASDSKLSVVMAKLTQK